MPWGVIENFNLKEINNKLEKRYKLKDHKNLISNINIIMATIGFIGGIVGHLIDYSEQPKAYPNFPFSIIFDPNFSIITAICIGYVIAYILNEKGYSFFAFMITILLIYTVLIILSFPFTLNTLPYFYYLILPIIIASLYFSKSMMNKILVFNILIILSITLLGEGITLIDMSSVIIFNIIASLLIIQISTYREQLEDEYYESQEKLLQSQKMDALGKLAGGVAHDFNNLLTGINGYSEILLEEKQASDSDYPLLKEIHDAGKRATVLTEQLLTFSKKSVTQLGIFDVNEMIMEMQNLFEMYLKEKPISLQLDLTVAPCPIKIDKSKFQLILLNLVINARDAIPNDGEIIIATSNNVNEIPSIDEESTNEDYVMIKIRDTGMGIKENNLTRIFEPFYTTKEQGIGLGLSTVNDIIEENNGSIQVTSEVSRGSTFYIKFPLVEKEITEKREQKVHKSIKNRENNETILIIDDNKSVLNIIKNHLEPLGFKIIQASFEEEAISKINEYEKEIDLVLTDMILEKNLDINLYKRIKQGLPKVEIIFISGFSREDICSELNIEDINYLQKPFTKQELTRSIYERFTE